MHLDNIWVVNFLERQNFSLHCFPLHAVIKFGFLVNFDCKLFHGDLMKANVNNGVSSLADGLADLIVFKGSCGAWVAA
jgi:hypothetical protein